MLFTNKQIFLPILLAVLFDIVFDFAQCCVQCFVQYWQSFCTHCTYWTSFNLLYIQHKILRNCTRNCNGLVCRCRPSQSSWRPWPHSPSRMVARRWSCAGSHRRRHAWGAATEPASGSNVSDSPKRQSRPTRRRKSVSRARSQSHLDSWYPKISYVDIQHRRLPYDIVVQTYDVVHNIVGTFPIGYPMYMISYVNTTISYVHHTIS